MKPADNPIFISSESPEFEAFDACYLNGIYFDGMLQAHFGHDCCGILPCGGKGDPRQLNGGDIVTPGVFPCTVHGYPHPCLAFIWEYRLCRIPREKQQPPPFWRGLVIDLSDSPALQKAASAFNEQRQYL